MLCPNGSVSQPSQPPQPLALAFFPLLWSYSFGRDGDGGTLFQSEYSTVTLISDSDQLSLSMNCCSLGKEISLLKNESSVHLQKNCLHHCLSGKVGPPIPLIPPAPAGAVLCRGRGAKAGGFCSFRVPGVLACVEVGGCHFLMFPQSP